MVRRGAVPINLWGREGDSVLAVLSGSAASGLHPLQRVPLRPGATL